MLTEQILPPANAGWLGSAAISKGGTDRGTTLSFPNCKSQAGGGPAVQAAHHLLHLDAPSPTATPVLHWWCSLPEIQAASQTAAGPAA